MDKEYIGEYIIAEEVIAYHEEEFILDLKDEHLTYAKHMTASEILVMNLPFELN